MDLIHPIICKPQFSKDKVLQRLFNKYQITFENIWGKDVVIPLLVELEYYKILEPLKDPPNLSHILHKNYL